VSKTFTVTVLSATPANGENVNINGFAFTVEHVDGVYGVVLPDGRREEEFAPDEGVGGVATALAVAISYAYLLTPELTGISAGAAGAAVTVTGADTVTATGTSFAVEEASGHGHFRRNRQLRAGSRGANYAN